KGISTNSYIGTRIFSFMTCVNCQAGVSGNFCAKCGQRANVNRISLRESWFDVWSRVYGFDGMAPRTLTDLTLRPGVAAKRFIEGNRVMYYGPVGYFFLMITLCLLFFSIIGVDFFDFMKGMQQGLPTRNDAPKLTEIVQRFISDNIKMFAFLIIPFQALSARYLFFRRSGYNYLEHAVLPLYMAGHMYWVTMVAGVIYKWTGHAYLLADTIVGALYIGFGYSTMMTYQSRLKAFFKGVLLYVTSQIFFMMAALLIGAIMIVLIYWLSPETFEALRPSNNR
ncbi:MAG TPA: DUF3667 domain-containing protein, partial [Cyclobacteriaceae bacterium]|nr:DUF3667 domain-containing protein [Cyclobacteriaceae bacterium]